MALIVCPECGREISDKAESCPGCGCPADEINKTESERFEEIEEDQIKKVFNESKTDLRIDLGKDSYIEIRGDIMKIHSTIRDVTDYIRNYVLLYDKDTFGVPCVRFTHDTFYAPIRLEPLWGNKNIDKIREFSHILREKAIVNEKGMFGSANFQTDVQKERSKKEYEQRKQEYANRPKESIDWSSVIAERKIPKCPKCKSTSISYTTKKLSLGRAAVGYGLVGPTGAVLGGLSSKKGYAVCLNCGKRWKI